MVLFFCTLVVTFLGAAEEHQFLGKHFIASYLECDSEALQNVEKLMQVMREGARRSGAQALNDIHHVFPGNGLTMVILLAESHLSIHTYPEIGACFVDLFTCGDHCQHGPCDKVLRDYLKPRSVNSKVLTRSEEIHEHAH